MAEVRNERLICKHFNMSWIQVRDELTLYEFYPLLAESLDAEELDDYNLATMVAIGVNDPKRLKKWNWASSDRAGTRSSISGNPFATLAQFAAAGGDLSAKSDPFAFAKHTGRRIVFFDAEGNHFDEAGESVEPAKDDFRLPIANFKDRLKWPL